MTGLPAHKHRPTSHGHRHKVPKHVLAVFHHWTHWERGRRHLLTVPILSASNLNTNEVSAGVREAQVCEEGAEGGDEHTHAVEMEGVIHFV